MEDPTLYFSNSYNITYKSSKVIAKMGSSLLIAAYICIATATAARGWRAGRGRDNLGIAARREVITAELLSKKRHSCITSCFELH